MIQYRILTKALTVEVSSRGDTLTMQKHFPVESDADAILSSCCSKMDQKLVLVVRLSPYECQANACRSFGTGIIAVHSAGPDDNEVVGCLPLLLLFRPIDCLT